MERPLLESDLIAEVRRLTARHEGTLLSYGCGELAFDLVKHGLVDELRFWVHPIAWAEPERPFQGLGHVRMCLVSSTVFHTGVTLQTCEPLSVDEEARDRRRSTARSWRKPRHLALRWNSSGRGCGLG